MLFNMQSEDFLINLILDRTLNLYCSGWLGAEVMYCTAALWLPACQRVYKSQNFHELYHSWLVRDDKVCISTANHALSIGLFPNIFKWQVLEESKCKTLGGNGGDGGHNLCICYAWFLFGTVCLSMNKYFKKHILFDLNKTCDDTDKYCLDHRQYQRDVCCHVV